MQAQTIPISINTASAAPAARGPADGAADASTPFAEALSREIDQRQQASDAAASAPEQDAAAAAAAGASASQPADLPVETDETADAADDTAITPVTDMLALVASLAQPARLAPAPTDAVAEGAATSVIPGPGASSARTHAELTDQITAAVPAGAAASPVAMALVPGQADASAPIVPTADTAPPSAALAQAPTGKTDADMRAQGGAPASAASAMFAQALAQAFQATGANPAARPVPEGTVQLRSMFATAVALPSQGLAAGVPADAAVDARELPAGVAAHPIHAAARAAAADKVADAQQEVAALAAPGGQTAAKAPTPEAPGQPTPFTAQLQAARNEQVHANPMLAGDRLPARVGTPAWDKQLGQKIVFMAAGAEQSASLTLNPPDLGPVQVVLNISNDQASVAFSSSQLEVRQALENAMPKLREMMGESGITLGNATVNAGMPEQQQQAQRGRDAQSPGHTGNGRGNGGRAGGDDAAPVAAPARRTAAGAVDTFA